MIRVILDVLPEQLPEEVAAAIIGQNTVLVDGNEKPALYFENKYKNLAESLHGEILITE